MAEQDGDAGRDGARAEMLRRLRRVQQVTSTETEDSSTGIRRDYRSRHPHPDPAALLAERVADYGAGVHRCAAGEVGATVAEILAARGANTGAGIVMPPGLPRAWWPSDVPTLVDDPPLSTAQLDAADGVLTGCAIAVAETGTLILDAAAGQGRRMITLLPDYHLCVVVGGQIVTSVPEAIARLAPTRPLTFISGPSATSDIELERVEGVHGPRRLDVLLVG